MGDQRGLSGECVVEDLESLFGVMEGLEEAFVEIILGRARRECVGAALNRDISLPPRGPCGPRVFPPPGPPLVEEGLPPSRPRHYKTRSGPAATAPTPPPRPGP